MIEVPHFHSFPVRRDLVLPTGIITYSITDFYFFQIQISLPHLLFLRILNKFFILELFCFPYGETCGIFNPIGPFAGGTCGISGVFVYRLESHG